MVTEARSWPSTAEPCLSLQGHGVVLHRRPPSTPLPPDLLNGSNLYCMPQPKTRNKVVLLLKVPVYDKTLIFKTVFKNFFKKNGPLYTRNI